MAGYVFVCVSVGFSLCMYVFVSGSRGVGGVQFSDWVLDDSQDSFVVVWGPASLEPSCVSLPCSAATLCIRLKSAFNL